MSQGMVLVLQPRVESNGAQGSFCVVYKNVHWLATSHVTDGQPCAIPEICQAGSSQSIVVIPGMQATFLQLLWLRRVICVVTFLFK